MLNTLKAIAIAIALGFAFGHVAHAHSFYSSVCCGGRDCAPVPVDVVRETVDGIYITPRGTTLPPRFLPWGDQKIKKIPTDADISDEERASWHICTAGGKPDGLLYCAYRPDSGF